MKYSCRTYNYLLENVKNFKNQSKSSADIKPTKKVKVTRR